jgi:hypothetical protein
VTGSRLRPTPAITTVCGVPAGRVFTTSYNDGIEREGASIGLRAIPLLGQVPRIQQPPEPGELRVVHMHGLPSEPQSRMLPSRSMIETRL